MQSDDTEGHRKRKRRKVQVQGGHPESDPALPYFVTESNSATTPQPAPEPSASTTVVAPAVVAAKRPPRISRRRGKTSKPSKKVSKSTPIIAPVATFVNRMSATELLRAVGLWEYFPNVRPRAIHDLESFFWSIAYVIFHRSVHDPRGQSWGKAGELHKEFEALFCAVDAKDLVWKRRERIGKSRFHVAAGVGRWDEMEALLAYQKEFEPNPAMCGCLKALWVWLRDMQPEPWALGQQEDLQDSLFVYFLRMFPWTNPPRYKRTEQDAIEAPEESTSTLDHGDLLRLLQCLMGSMDEAVNAAEINQGLEVVEAESEGDEGGGEWGYEDGEYEESEDGPEAMVVDEDEIVEEDDGVGGSDEDVDLHWSTDLSSSEDTSSEDEQGEGGS